MHVEIAIGNRDIFLNKHELQRDLSIMCTNVKLWYFVGQYTVPAINQLTDG